MIFNCIKTNRPDLLGLILQDNPDLTMRYKDMSPLEYAVSKNNIECTKLLLKDGTLSTALRYCNNIQIAELLLNSGADINTVDDNGSLLHTNVHFNKVNMVEFLLNNGANPNLVNKYGESPLYMTAYMEYIPVMKLLLDYKADSSLRPHKRGSGPPLVTAIRNRKVRAIRMLIDHQADLHYIDDYGETLLHEAVHFGNYEIVSLLLDAGVDPTICDRYGKTPASCTRDASIKDLIDNYYPPDVKEPDN